MSEKEHKGLRFNSHKTRHDLVPAYAQEQYAKVMTAGFLKYGADNWRKGQAWSTVIASAERHLNAFKQGEDYDPETGQLHSAHLMCNAAFLTEFYKIYPEGDDRPHAYLTPKKIALDIDEVLCNWTSAWCNYWKMNVPSTWYFDRLIGQRFKEMEESGTLDDFYRNLTVLTPADDIPFEPMAYVTSRPVATEVTMEWLDKHGYPTCPVYTVDMSQSKVDVLQQIGCEIFVDDRFDNFVELNRAGICCYLFDAPHNRRYDVGYKRIKSLKEIV